MVLDFAWHHAGTSSCVHLANTTLFMNLLDWIILFGTLATIVIYGTWKTRGAKNMESYLKGDNSMKW